MCGPPLYYLLACDCTLGRVSCNWVKGGVSYGLCPGYHQPWVSHVGRQQLWASLAETDSVCHLLVWLFVGGRIRSMRRLRWKFRSGRSLTSGLTILSSTGCDSLLTSIAVISEMSLSRTIDTSIFPTIFLNELWLAFLGLMQNGKGFVFADTSHFLCGSQWQWTCLREVRCFALDPPWFWCIIRFIERKCGDLNA